MEYYIDLLCMTAILHYVMQVTTFSLDGMNEAIIRFVKWYDMIHLNKECLNTLWLTSYIFLMHNYSGRHLRHVFGFVEIFLLIK
jgi:hypothetical protein